MANIGINFGSATSGAGFDVASTVAGILSSARAPEAAWQARSTALGKQDAVLTTLGTDLSALSTSLSSLTNFDGVFAGKRSGVSDTTVLAISSTDTSAIAGTHSLTVQQLAQTSSQYSNAFAASTTLNGTLTIQVGNGAVNQVALGSGGQTIAGLASAINAAQAGVTASVVSDRNGSRLSITSNTQGAAGQITLGGSVTDGSGNALTFVSSQSGQDAQYTLDGISLTSSTNAVSGALAGVQFQLLAQSAAPVTLQIANDTASIVTALSSFVSAYNSLNSAISQQEGNDSTGGAQPLFGNPVIATLQEQLSSAFTAAQGSGAISLPSLGLGFTAAGQLSLDTTALQNTLASNFSGAATFFQHAGNFGQNFATALNNLGSTGTGALALATRQNASEEAQLSGNTAALETRLTSYQATLTNQLNAANQILQGIPQQLNEVNQIYAAITGYNPTRNGG